MAENDTGMPMTSPGEGEHQINFEDQTTISAKIVARLRQVGKWCRGNLLLTLTISGVIAGVILGFSLRKANLSDRDIMLLSFPGDVLMRMLKMLIVPLIISCMVTGLATLDAQSSGKMGLRAIAYYLCTTFIAIILGIILVMSIKPGEGGSSKDNCDGEKAIEASDAILDLIRNLFPSNIVQATFQHTKTEFHNVSANTCKNTTWDYERRNPMSDGVNVLGLLSFFTAFSIMLGSMGAKAKVMLDFFTVLNEIVMRMVMLIMWYSPIGITFLIAGKILSLKDPEAVGQRLGMYMLTVFLGLFIHTVIILPGLYFALTRKNPLIIMRGIIQAYVTALGTSSSAATLPVTFKCLEEKLHIDKRVTRFVLPIGATINMDGTALYEAVAPVFIAQMNGISLSFAKVIVLSLTATCASIGAASIPGAGMLTMMMVLSSLDLDPEDIAMIYAVDWLVDRFRTATNVLGDSFGAAVVEHLSRAELRDNRQSLAVTEINMLEVEMRQMRRRTVEEKI